MSIEQVEIDVTELGVASDETRGPPNGHSELGGQSQATGISDDD